MITFSIVTITYNAASVLQPTLDSVFMQDYKHIEHLIIDGASKDDTVSMAEAYKKKVAEADAFAHEKQERQQVLSATVERFFDKLSPRQQQIINLYYIEQRKYDDICRIMGINYQSVRNLMHRSIMRLRSLAEAVDVAV